MPKTRVCDCPGATRSRQFRFVGRCRVAWFVVALFQEPGAASSSDRSGKPALIVASIVRTSVS